MRHIDLGRFMEGLLPRFIIVLAILLVMLGSAAVYSTPVPAAFTQKKKKALATIQPQYDHIMTAASQDPQLQQFRQRIDLLNQIANLMAARLQSTRSSSLDSLLGEVSKAPQNTDFSTPGGQTLSAMDILEEYQDAFSQALPKPNISKEDLQVLRQYYDALLQVSEEYVAQRGKLVAAMDKQGAVEVPRLCVVLMFLHVPDDQWSSKQITSLEPWLRKPEVLATLEDFALLAQRPLTAYQFFLARGGKTVSLPPKGNIRQAKAPKTKVSATQPTLPGYLHDTATQLVKRRDYRAALSCLKTAIDLAQKQNQLDEVATLRLQLAQILEEVGHPQLAADEVKKLLSGPTENTERGRSAMFRLKYLYESEKFNDLLTESKQYAADSRCAPYLPQILYLQWVAQRRTDQAEAATRSEAAFLKEFPDHPLGADMHFASAMTALAASNYDEALRELEVIQYRYPQSRLIPKVKEIQERLKKVSSQSPSQ